MPFSSPPGRSTPEERKAKARLAINSRWHPELREIDTRELKALSAERYVTDLVQDWPPLRPDQLDHLAEILRPSTIDDIRP